eukprot:2697246-Pleurochrysis_carterae.AAC.1
MVETAVWSKWGDVMRGMTKRGETRGSEGGSERERKEAGRERTGVGEEHGEKRRKMITKMETSEKLPSQESRADGRRPLCTLRQRFNMLICFEFEYQQSCMQACLDTAECEHHRARGVAQISAEGDRLDKREAVVHLPPRKF